jgi:hypothetical protein
MTEIAGHVLDAIDGALEDYELADAMRWSPRPEVPAGSEFVACDTRELLRQIGMMNVLATSGGRVEHRATGVTLKCGCGYYVTVDLAPGDTYTVRREFRRAGKVAVRGERTGVYCDEVGEQVYRAGCFRDTWT